MSKLKVWIGPELEGIDKGKITMFVKSTHPNTAYVIDYLKDNPECKRLYLGAGRTDVIEYPIPLFDYCDDNYIDVVIETTPANLKYIPQEISNSYPIIVRFEAPELTSITNADFIKVDTFSKVYISRVDLTVHTDLSTLRGDMFNEDRIIFDGEATE